MPLTFNVSLIVSFKHKKPNAKPVSSIDESLGIHVGVGLGFGSRRQSVTVVGES